MGQIKCYPPIDILFFERPLVDLKRFAFKIAKELKSKNKNLKLASVSLELPNQEEETGIDYHYHRNQIKDIDVFLKKSGIKMIIFSNHRIPDMEFILHAKRNGVKTVLLQEGIIFRGQNINEISLGNIVAALGCLPKVFSYFHILKQMCKYDGQNFSKLVGKMFKEKLDITNLVSRSYSMPLNCDFVFSMGQYWNDYYQNKAGYRNDQIRIIGNHDLDSFVPRNDKEAAICYIATILVEDGTVSKKQFDVFVNALAEAVDPATKLYIKLHPRSNQDLYNSLKGHNITFIRTGTLPSVNVYIGHSSTLLGRALYESDQLILYRFKGEKESFYEKFAMAVCTDNQTLKTAVRTADISSTTNKRRADIEQVYWRNPAGAIATAAEYIFEYLTTDIISDFIAPEGNVF